MEEQLKEIEDQLVTLYWESTDNRDLRVAKRIDTIIGKLQELQKIIANQK